MIAHFKSYNIECFGIESVQLTLNEYDVIKSTSTQGITSFKIRKNLKKGGYL